MFLILKVIFPIWITVYGALDKILIDNGGNLPTSNLQKTSNYLSINKYLSNYSVLLNWSWFLIQSKVLNFHNWILCYHELFHDKIKTLKSIELSMDLWHLDNLKVISTLWTLIYGDCVPFLCWSFPYSQLSQLLSENLILELSKNMIKPPLIWLMHLIL